MDLREQIGLTDDKPTVLVCSDSATLPTGLARVVRGIFTPIYRRGNFQVVQHGWFFVDPPSIRVPWRTIPVFRHEADPRAFKQSDKMGAESFDQVVAQIRPDVVFTVTDFDRIGHLVGSPHRPSYALVAYLPLDVYPPRPRWAEVVQQPDRTVYYTEFAAQWGAAAGAPGVSIPHGVDTTLYRPVDDEQRKALRHKFFGIDDDTLLVGSVGRNQSRKRFDLLIEAAAYLRAGAYRVCDVCGCTQMGSYRLPGGTFTKPEGKCGHCGQNSWRGQAWPTLALYLHTDPDEPGADAVPIRRIIATWGLDDHVKLNPAIDLRMGRGLSDEMMASFLNCLDVYAHACNGGGWELPPMEAAACGVPLVCVDAPAQNEWMRTVPDCRMVKGLSLFVRTADGYRVEGDVADLVGQLHRTLSERRRSNANVAWIQDYTWERISERWEQVFTEVLDPNTRIDPWRVLQEA